METEATRRMGVARKRLDRFREDVGEWKRAHDRVREVWHCEDLIRDAVHVYEGLLRLDEDVRLQSFSSGNFPEGFDQSVRGLLKSWLAEAGALVPEVERHESSFEVAGAAAFRQSLRDAERILVPDSEFFRGDRIDRMQKRALADHRAGLTEPV